MVCGLLALPAVLYAAQTPLSLPEAQRRAAERSRQLATQDSAVSASREMAVAAGELPDPTLQFGIDNLPVDGPDKFSISRDFMMMRRIGVMQQFTREEKRQLRVERFEREAEGGVAEKSATLAMIQRDTALAWLDGYYAEALAGVIAEQMREAQLEIELPKAPTEPGEAVGPMSSRRAPPSSPWKTARAKSGAASEPQRPRWRTGWGKWSMRRWKASRRSTWFDGMEATLGREALPLLYSMAKVVRKSSCLPCCTVWQAM